MNASIANIPADERRVIPGTPIFGPREAARGYRLNAMCFSFNDADNRAAFQSDPLGYCRRYKLDDDQTRAAVGGDVPGLIAAGGNIYYLAKLAGIFGLSVQDVGALQTGMSVAEFKQMLADQGKAH